VSRASWEGAAGGHVGGLGRSGKGGIGNEEGNPKIVYI
jgi:hypothetical protein